MASEKQMTEELEKEIDDWCNIIADKIFELSQRNLVKEKKVDTGFLLKTGNINREYLHKTIIYPAPYADNVHYGRAAGTMPPVEPIARWAARQGIKNPEKAAWAIAKAIEKRGIKATPYLQEALETVSSTNP